MMVALITAILSSGKTFVSNQKRCLTVKAQSLMRICCNHFLYGLDSNMHFSQFPDGESDFPQ